MQESIATPSHAFVGLSDGAMIFQTRPKLRNMYYDLLYYVYKMMEQVQRVKKVDLHGDFIIFTI
jgi:hypothetical protein